MITWTAEELPRPTQDLDRLESDMDVFGYCLIADALTTEETAALRARITEQAAGERAHGHHRRSQVQDPAWSTSGSTCCSTRAGCSATSCSIPS